MTVTCRRRRLVEQDDILLIFNSVGTLADALFAVAAAAAVRRAANPAYDARALRLAKLRTNSSRTTTVGLCTPTPLSAANCWITPPASS